MATKPASSHANLQKKSAAAGALKALPAALSALFLAFALVGSGLFLCCAPLTTQVLASLFSRSLESPFTHEELVEAALATRDYTVGDHSRDEVLRLLYDINLSSAEAGRNTLHGAPDLTNLEEVPATDELAARFMPAEDTYVLTDDALSHLDDVYQLISSARIAVVISAVLGLIGCVIEAFLGGRKYLGRICVAAAVLVVVIFAALAAWAIFDFTTFFTFLHSLFFKEGTWTFSSDSLLIRMYPTEFWIGMGATWLATTALACALCFIIGLLVKGRRKRLS